MRLTFLLAAVIWLFGTACQRLSQTSKPEVVEPLAIGQVAPDIVLPDSSGRMVSVASLRGKYVLISVWAPECDACQQQLGNLQKLQRQFGSRGVAQYSIGLTTRRSAWRQALQTDARPGLQVWASPAEAARLKQLLGVTEPPYTVLLDPDGRVLSLNLQGRTLGQKLSTYIPLD